MPVLFIVLPVFNEARALPGLLCDLERTCADLEGYTAHYVLVDDGSTDESPDILAGHAGRSLSSIITHKPNKGLGVTIRDGLARAVELAGPGDLILTMDADNTHPVDHVPGMLDLIDSGADIVIASRFQPGARVRGLSPFRRLLTVGARFLYQVFFPVKGLRDYTCGFRIYRSSLLKKAFDYYGDSFIEYQGFSAMADILLRLRRFSPVVREVPLDLRYDRKPGASKMPVWRTVFSTLAMLVKRRLEFTDRKSRPR